jgi:UDP-glucuronate 4-epimerase
LLERNPGIQWQTDKIVLTPPGCRERGRDPSLFQCYSRQRLERLQSLWPGNLLLSLRFPFLFSNEGNADVAGEPKRILLTGGAGFIGSHVAEALLRRGAALSIVDSLDHFYSPTWKKGNLEDVRRTGRFEFFERDICELEMMRETVAATRPDVIIHLAARAGVRPSIEQPRLYEHVNVAGTVNLLELCREFRVEKFIFGSSSSVYGMSSRAPFSEEQPQLHPISPYAATKLAGELFCYTYAHLYALPAICLRFFTVFGPRQRPDLAIHKFVARIERGEPLPIFGEGETGRDYTYVDDIVAGVLAAVDYTPRSVDGAPFDVFNLGNSHPVKLMELVDLIEKVTGKRAIREHKDQQPGDVPLTWADISKAGRLLGYRPQTASESLLRGIALPRLTGAPRILRSLFSVRVEVTPTHCAHLEK